jgi:hypothetical protein
MLLGNNPSGPFFGNTSITENQLSINESSIAQSWSVVPNTINNSGWTNIAASSDARYQTAIGNLSGIYVSNDYGNTWAIKLASPITWAATNMSGDGQYQIACSTQYLYVSQNFGDTWALKALAIGTTRNWSSVHISMDGRIQVACVNDPINGYVYMSSDYGNTWAASLSSIGARAWSSITTSSDGKYQTACVKSTTTSGHVFVSIDYGTTWRAAISDANRLWNHVDMSADGRYQTAVVDGGFIYVSSDFGSTWSQVGVSASWKSVAMSASGKIQIAHKLTSSDLYLSVNWGTDWTLISGPAGANNWVDTAMSSDAKVLLALETTNGVYRSFSSSSINGNVGIGYSQSSTSDDKLLTYSSAIDGRIYVGTATVGDGIPSYVISRSFGSTPHIQMSRRNGTLASPSPAADGDMLGTVQFAGYTSTVGGAEAAAISVQVNGTVSLTSLPTTMMFYTSPSSSLGIRERMRITSDGNVGIGTDAPNERLTIDKNMSFVGASAHYIKTECGSDNGFIVFGGTSTGANSYLIHPYYSLSSVSSPIWSDYWLDTILPYQERKVVYGSEHITRCFLVSGTAVNPLAVASDAYIAGIRSFAYSGNGKFNSYGLGGNAAIDFRAAGDQSLTNSGGYITFNTMPMNSGTSTSTIERMRITSDGNVGIGTSTPAKKLSVVGNASFGAEITTGNSVSTDDCRIEIGANRTGNGNAYVDFHSAPGTDYGARIGKDPTTNGNFGMYNAGSGNLVLLSENSGAGNIWFGTSNTERMRIDASGNVGIGTSSPADKLHVNGCLKLGPSQGVRCADDTSNVFFAGGTNFDKGGFINLHGPSSAAGGIIVFKSGSDAVNIERMRITAAGNVGIGTSAPEVKLDLSEASVAQIRVKESVNGVDTRLVSVGGTGNAGIVGTYSNHPFVVNTNNTERMRIDSTGNVGIGTSTPRSKLDVEGDISTVWNSYFSSNLYYDYSAGNWKYKANGFGGLFKLAGNAGGLLYNSAPNNTLGANASAPITEHFRITPDGNVGIGTSAPTAWGKLAVVGNVSGGTVVASIVNTAATANTQAVLSLDTLGNGFNIRDSQIRATNNGSNATTLEFYTSLGAPPVERMRITATGNVGIGTANPQVKLEVNGVTSSTSFKDTAVSAAIGSSYAVNLASGSTFILTLQSGTPATISLPTPSVGQSFIVFIKQPSSGSPTTATFSASPSVKWSGGSAPTITATLNKTDIISFVTDGGGWYGSFAQNF